jgi:transcriptional regulator with XRE-family HTH domain
MESLGEAIKNLREKNNLPLRKVAAYLDIDQAILSKIEHGTRMPKRGQVVQLANFFKVDDKLLLIKWLAARILTELENDELALEAISLAEAYIQNKTGKVNKEKPVVLDYLKLGNAAGTKTIFIGNKLPSYTELSRYLFNTITDKKISIDAINTQTGFIGEGLEQEIYLFYKPDLEWLKNNALTLNMIKQLPAYNGKKRLIFASLKYVDDETCRIHHVEFGKIPY